jgi:hypothetical protein
MTRTRLAFRRFALVLAAAQVVAYGAAPLLEAGIERNPGPAHVERAHSHPCVPLHAPDACLACQLLTASADTPDIVRVSLPSDKRCRIEGVVLNAMAPRPPPAIFQTRAPPPDLA